MWSTQNNQHLIIPINTPGPQCHRGAGLNLKPQNKTPKSRRPVPMIPPLYDALTAAPKDSEFVANAAMCILFKHINRILPNVPVNSLTTLPQRPLKTAKLATPMETKNKTL